MSRSSIVVIAPDSVGGGGDDSVSALLDEAAVRFDFSQYDDIDNMVDVNGGWGPWSDLGSHTNELTFVADGLQLVTDGIESAVTLKPGTGSPVVGPLSFGPDGLSFVNVARFDGDLESVVLKVDTGDFQANSIGGEGTGYPQGDGIQWRIPAGGTGVAAAFYDSEPSEDEIVDLAETWPPVAVVAGVYVAAYMLDVPNEELRVRVVGPDIDQSFTQGFSKAVPDFAGTPWFVDEVISDLRITFTGAPGVASATQIEWLGWNRALTPVEVDALVAHFSA